MLRTLLAGVAAFAALCLVSLPVRAQPQPAGPQARDDYARSGPYLLVGPAVGFYTGVDDPFEVDAAAGVDGRVGFRAHPNAAMEIEFEYLAKADFGIFGVDVATLESLFFSMNFKGYLLTGRFQPFVLLGNGFTSAELSVPGFFSQREQDYALRFGAGADYYLTRRIMATLGVAYVLPLGDLLGIDIDYVSIQGGLGYRF